MIFVRLNVLSDCSFFLSSFFMTKKLNDYLSDNFWWCINRINLSQTRMLFWTIIIRITGIVVSRSLFNARVEITLKSSVGKNTSLYSRNIKILEKSKSFIERWARFWKAHRCWRISLSRVPKWSAYTPNLKGKMHTCKNFVWLIIVEAMKLIRCTFNTFYKERNRVESLESK